MLPMIATAGPLLGTPVDWTIARSSGSSLSTVLSSATPITQGQNPLTAGQGLVVGSDVPLITTAIQNSTSAPFASLLSEAVGQVDQLEKRARTAVEGLMSGKGVDVHEAMIATEKSEMGFELMLAVRNKALAAYQQVVSMQF